MYQSIRTVGTYMCILVALIFPIF